ncbi:MAG: ATP-binding protein [Syntrophaceae bacterium]
MRLRLGYKLFLTILTTSLVSIVLMSGIMRYFIQRDFENFIHKVEAERMSEITEKLGAFYRQEQGWNALAQDPRVFERILRPEFPPHEPHGLPDLHGKDAPRPLAKVEPPIPGGLHPRPRLQTPPDRIEPRLALYDDQHRLVAGNSAPAQDQIVRPVEVDGLTVGYVHLRKRQALSTPLEKDFVYRQTRTFLFTGTAVLILAVMTAYLFSRHLLKPVRELTKGAHALASRKFETRITVKSGDELGLLADDFNRMAQTLERHEHLHRQWLSDISHELRTPLTVLKGEIEAIIDGVREIDGKNLQSLHAEVLVLEKLVQDLHELSVADTQGLSNALETVDVLAVLRESLVLYVSRFSQSGLNIVNELVHDAPVMVMADRDRLSQVFVNLYENTIRYTQSPGTLKIWAEVDQNQVRLNFEDGWPGVPEEALEKLFDRLYRLDSARSRKDGGSGLGLAICKSLVESWGGGIRAMHSSLGGLRIEIVLPRVREEV